jgi:hypothetical protein
MSLGSAVTHRVRDDHGEPGAGKLARRVCAARRFVVSPVQPGGTWRNIPGSTAYLDAKARGDNSMPVKHWLAKGARGGALQNPRDMAKAGLLAAQSPAVKVSPIGMTPETDACVMPHREPWGAGQPPWRRAPPSEGGQGDEWAAYVTLDTYDEDERGIASTRK